MESVILKKGKEKIFHQRHHWIFSGAVDSFPKGYQNGALVSIKSYDGRLQGWGYFNQKCSLSGRIVSFGEEDVYISLKNSIIRALNLRENLLHNPQTTACRLINGEGDGLPGLVVDKYGPYLVMQTGSLGMHKLLPFFCDQFREKLSILGIYDKSSENALNAERIERQEKILWGDVPDEVTVKEDGIPFRISLKKGQKTGFFLDQREMRKVIATLSFGKSVLNGFCYTGGFTLAALKGGASRVDSVDTSATALELCKENVELNGFMHVPNQFFQEDMFDFLNDNECDYDLMILDPPAFAKKKKDIPTATKGYRRLFKLAMQKMPANSLLMLSSCSYYITEQLFKNLVIDAALSAHRPVQIIGHHRHALDHPINLFHPESNYLKSLLVAL